MILNRTTLKMGQGTKIISVCSKLETLVLEMNYMQSSTSKEMLKKNLI